MTAVESVVEQQRRAWVERQERHRDVHEVYATELGRLNDARQRQELMNKHSAYLHAHRAADVAGGKRPAGTAVLSRQVMWARWIEVAVEHELHARLEFARMKSDPESDAIVAELRASLVAISACAHTIDALYGDIKYLVASPTRRKSRERRLADAFGTAFGDPPNRQRLGDQLAWLFDLRDFAVHPYTEDEVVRQHPSGILTDPLAARFNAVEAGRAVDLTMRVLAAAAAPTSPGGHWIERWVNDRSAYHSSVVEPLKARRIRATPVHGVTSDT